MRTLGDMRREEAALKGSLRPGIPTNYRGTEFRSRLEARWAAFFDLIGWSWVYEPVDAEGYIIDFLIKGERPFYVEVGPCVSVAELRQKAAKANANAHILRRDALIVGADITPLWFGEYGDGDCGGSICGYQVGDRCGCDMDGTFAWAEGAWTTCLEVDGVSVEKTRRGPDDLYTYMGRAPGCRSVGVTHTEMSYTVRPCGHYPGGRIHEPPRNLDHLWSVAGNEVQWRPA